jgi:hypothetical protein
MELKNEAQYVSSKDVGWRVPHNNKTLISNILFLLTTNFVLNCHKWFIVGSLDPFIIINVVTFDN